MPKSHCRQCAAFVELKFFDLSAGVLNLEKTSLITGYCSYLYRYIIPKNV